MIRIPCGETIARPLRLALVMAVAATALGISIPNLLTSANPLALGWYDFDTSANVVVDAGSRARAAGISVGDRIDYARMPADRRYGDPTDGLREPQAGKVNPFAVVDRSGREHISRLAVDSVAWPAEWRYALPMLEFAGQKTIFLMLVLLAAALVLIRPTRLSTAFFLFVAGNGVMPVMYSFLPPAAYAYVMVADDALSGLGAVGFLGLAFYLDPKRHIRSRAAFWIAALLLTLVVVPMAVSDVLELLAGSRPAWPIAGWASFSAVLFCYVAGFALLVRTAANAARPRSLRLVAGLLAAVGTLTIFDWTVNAQLSVWYFANLPGVAMNRGILADRPLLFPLWAYTGYLFILRLLGSLFAFYAIVRAGVADAGPVVRRIVAYVIVALFIVAAFAFANLALMPHVADDAVVIPLEIFAAIGVGYWVSGLRDLASCLSLACVHAFDAWANGRLQEERDVLVQSLGLAERTRRQGIIAEVRAQIAFSSWRNGEDGAFDQKVVALRRALRGRNMRGIHAFAHAAAAPADELRFQDEDLPEWRARAALVRCAQAEDADRARRFALDALASADCTSLPSLQVLAAIAVAETCGEQRDAALERANVIARNAGWPALSKSILALRANSRDIGILQTFVDVRFRKSRPARATFYISFFNAELSVNGERVPLTEKQLELLLTVASARTGINDGALLDALWPDSDGDAARNSLRVCLHGLRKSTGDARIITRIGKGLVLHPWADVDLWRFDSLVAACRAGGRADVTELHGLCRLLRAGEARRATVGEWFFRFDRVLYRKLDEAERLLQPLSSARNGELTLSVLD